MANGKIMCPLLEAEIDIGLCAEIICVGLLISKEAIPEINRFTEEEVIKACNSCPHTEGG